jgi:hypothetical protein
MPRTIKVKTLEPALESASKQALEQVPRRVIKVKKSVPLEEPAPAPAPVTVTAPKAPRTIKVKKSLPIPPPPAVGVYITKALEAFEALREYYRLQEAPIPNEDITWYHEELAREAAEMKAFWEEECTVTKAVSDAVFRGATDDELLIIEAKAKLTEKKRPVSAEDIGEMPEQGTREFWAWCMKRKQLRLQKEAAIIAAGGTVKPKAPKVPKAPKAPKVKTSPT